MRSTHVWLVLSGAVLLSACGGDTRPQSIGSGSAPPSGGTPVPTPTSAHSFVNPTEPKTYDGLGAVQHYEYWTDSNRADGKQGGQLYAGDANTVRNGGITIAYNPRDAIFEINIARPAGIVSVATSRFQDPVHRTDWGGAAGPQPGSPHLTHQRIQYLEAGGSSGIELTPSDAYWNDPRGQTANRTQLPVGAKGYNYLVQTLFYQKPSTEAGATRYVTYAGFMRQQIVGTEEQPDEAVEPWLRETYYFDRAAFVFGERTPIAAVPGTGEATYRGDMIATLVHNSMLDTNSVYPSYMQWMEGTQETRVKFASLKVETDLRGTVFAPAIEAYSTGQYQLAAGTTFSAYADATIDLINKGGFTGTFGCAAFGAQCVRDQALPVGALTIAGSSIDGAFFGPNGEEVGAGFRIVGGTPDERIDILGAFTGFKFSNSAARGQ